MKDYRFPCTAAKKCGGCQLTNLTYEEQLSLKQAKEIKLLGRFCRVSEILSTGEPFYYRNKVQAAFGRTRGGEIVSGVYQSSTHNIVKVDSCLLEDQRADAIIVTVRKMLSEFKLNVFDERKQTGFLRHVLVKVAQGTGEVMVVLVTGTKEFKSKNAFIETLLKRHPEITTVVQSYNPRFTSLVLGQEETVLYGSGYITDVLLGKRFMISPRSFYQVNYEGTKLLYQTVLDFADLKQTDRVIDAYAGVGTIGMICSDRVREVLSVELNKDAVADAKRNAKLNNVKNMTFSCADATQFLSDLAREKEKADLVIMDPPRAGSTVQFMKSVCRLSPKKIIYVSCNPETLARDLDYFIRNKYKVKKIQPVDMFPNTNHVETVVLLSQRRADEHIDIKLDLTELDLTAAESKATYDEIKAYILEKYNVKVSSLYISQVKRKLGLEVGKSFNKPKTENAKQPQCPPDKEKIIIAALKYFNMAE